MKVRICLSRLQTTLLNFLMTGFGRQPIRSRMTPTLTVAAMMQMADRLPGVLLKGFDNRGFVFYSNIESQKGREIAINPFVALCFSLEIVSARYALLDLLRGLWTRRPTHIRSRPRGSRIGAWASQQSRTLPDRRTLMEAAENADRKYQESVPRRPPYWSVAFVPAHNRILAGWRVSLA